jgi:hypothetical protein
MLIYFLGAFAKLRKATVMSVNLPARPSAWNSSTPMDGFFMKFDVWGFFKYLARKFKFH